jgi:hypothetical protein
MMNNRGTAGSSRRATRLSMSACTTAAFSVAPSMSPSAIEADRHDVASLVNLAPLNERVEDSLLELGTHGVHGFECIVLEYFPRISSHRFSFGLSSGE